MKLKQSVSMPLLAGLLLTGCDYAAHSGGPTTPSSPRMQIGRVDSTYKLTPVERASIGREFDASAVEKLLRMLPSGARAETLSQFQTNGGRGMLVGFPGNPELQAVLEEVYAPYWEGVPDDLLFTPTDEVIPGKEQAKKRRASRRAEHSQRQP